MEETGEIRKRRYILFHKGDYIVYGISGPCLITDVTRLSMPGCDGKRKYYVLHPVNAAKSTIYSPVDNDKVTIRQIMTREEAEELLQEVPGIQQIQVENEKMREEQYKEIMKNSDLHACIGLIKTLYHKRQVRLDQGRKFTTVDERYLREAMDMLTSELAIALGQDTEEAVKTLNGMLQP